MAKGFCAFLSVCLCVQTVVGQFGFFPQRENHNNGFQGFLQGRSRRTEDRFSGLFNMQPNRPAINTENQQDNIYVVEVAEGNPQNYYNNYNGQIFRRRISFPTNSPVYNENGQNNGNVNFQPNPNNGNFQPNYDIGEVYNQYQPPQDGGNGGYQDENNYENNVRPNEGFFTQREIRNNSFQGLITERFSGLLNMPSNRAAINTENQQDNIHVVKVAKGYPQNNYNNYNGQNFGRLISSFPTNSPVYNENGQNNGNVNFQPNPNNGNFQPNYDIGEVYNQYQPAQEGGNGGYQDENNYENNVRPNEGFFPQRENHNNGFQGFLQGRSRRTEDRFSGLFNMQPSRPAINTENQQDNIYVVEVAEGNPQNYYNNYNGQIFRRHISFPTNSPVYNENGQNNGNFNFQPNPNNGYFQPNYDIGEVYNQYQPPQDGGNGGYQDENNYENNVRPNEGFFPQRENRNNSFHGLITERFSGLFNMPCNRAAINTENQQDNIHVVKVAKGYPQNDYNNYNGQNFGRLISSFPTNSPVYNENRQNNGIVNFQLNPNNGNFQPNYDNEEMYNQYQPAQDGGNGGYQDEYNYENTVRPKYEVESCQTVEGGNDSCIPVVNCQPYLSVLRKSRTNPYAVKLAHCGFEGNTLKVCCPRRGIPATPVSPTPAPTPAPTPPPTQAPQTAGSKISPGDFVDALPEPPVCGPITGTFLKVVGGDPAQLGAFPWMALLGYKSKKSGTTSWLCGGTLISSRHVLTAAHCIHNYEEDLYLVRLGELDLTRTDEGATPIDVLIKQKYKHEHYSATDFSNDIGILLLDHDVTFTNLIRPICIPKDSNMRAMTFENYTPFLAGWGRTSFGGQNAWHLQFVQLHVVSNDYCAQEYKAHKIDDRVLCAGFGGRIKDACLGDSGGPLMQPIDWREKYNMFFYQSGVVSYGNKCGEAKYPGVYTRVTHFVPWIEEKVVGYSST